MKNGEHQKEITSEVNHMKKSLYLRRCLFLFIAFCILPLNISVHAQELADVEGHWAEEDIRVVMQNGWMQGYSDHIFGVDQPLSRAETAVVLHRIRGIPSGTAAFTDVATHHWAFASISAAADAGFMNGYPDNHFFPDQPITREEAAAVLVRAFALPPKEGEKSFSDVTSDRWSYEAIQTLTAHKVVNGYPDGSFQPLQSVSRAELAVFLSRIHGILDEPGEQVEEKSRQGEFIAALDFGQDNTVTFHNGEEKNVGEDYVPVFVNGRLVEYSGLLNDGQFYVQVEILEEISGAEYLATNGNWTIDNDRHTIVIHEQEGIVEVNGHKEDIALEHIGDITYIEITGLLPYLDGFDFCGHEAEHIDQPSLVRYPAIYLDRPFTEVAIGTAEEGLLRAQSLASEALEHYTVSLRENLAESGEDPARMDSSLAMIAEDIRNMYHVGEVSKYYVYDMDVYRVYVDRVSGDVYFHYEMGRATYMVFVDVHDPHLFTPLYIVG